MILVDTSVLIDYLKGRDNEGTRKFNDILDQKIDFGITNIIYLEILQGSRDENEFLKLKDYLETQRFYDVHDKKMSYEEAAKMYMKCRKKGYTIRSTVDLIICQVALDNDLYLLHNDSDYDALSKINKTLKIF